MDRFQFFQTEIEKMCDILLQRIDETAIKDEKWWKDLDITKKNLLNVLQPIQFDGYEWVLLSADISLHEPQKDYDWKDTYNIYSCSSKEEELKGDGNERCLTIETDYYYGNLLEYKSCKEKPWLCKYDFRPCRQRSLYGYRSYCRLYYRKLQAPGRC